MAYTELPPDPEPVDENERRLLRIEWKLNVLIGLVTVLTLYPIIGWFFGALQASGWILLVLLVVALVLAIFRERIPGFLKRSARWLVMKAIDAGPNEKKS